jgi:hypothetical protein
MQIVEQARGLHHFASNSVEFELARRVLSSSLTMPQIPGPISAALFSRRVTLPPKQGGDGELTGAGVS